MTPPAAPSRGRRPGNSEDTRRAILEAARTLFAEHGFGGASIRAIAERAGVDPALVHHYFGTKAALLTAALELPIGAPQLIDQVGHLPREQVGEAILRLALPLWEGPARPQITAAMRTALGDASSSSAIQEIVIDAVAKPVLTAVGVPPDELDVRCAAIESVMVGLLASRLLLEVPGMVGIDHEQVVAAYGPVLHRFICAPLDELGFTTRK